MGETKESKKKEVEIKTKSPMWVVILIAILVIALGCEFAYICNFKKSQSNIVTTVSNETNQVNVSNDVQENTYKTLNEMAIKKLTTGEVFYYDLDGNTTTEKIEIRGLSGDKSVILYINGARIEDSIDDELFLIDLDEDDGLMNIVTVTRTNGVGYKFSTYQNDKLISYNDYNDMWVSNNEDNIGDLLKINSEGEILLYDNILDGFEQEIYTKAYKFENGKLISDNSVSNVGDFLNKKIQYTSNGQTCIIENLDNIGEYYATYTEENLDTTTVNTKYNITDLKNEEIFLTVISTKEYDGYTYLKVMMDDGTQGYLILNAETAYAISQ